MGIIFVQSCAWGGIPFGPIWHIDLTLFFRSQNLAKARYRINPGEAGVTRDGVMTDACLSRAWIAFLERASILENTKNDGYSAEMVVIDFLSEAGVSVFFFALFCSFSLITRERATHSLANSRYMLHGRTTNSHFVKFLQVGHIVVSIGETVMWDISLSTGTIGTSIYTVYSRYNYLHCLQKVQLSTLSTEGITIYTVYRRYNYLHCLQ